MSIIAKLNQVAECLTKGNWMDHGEYLVFGWDEYIDAIGGRKSMTLDGQGRVTNENHATATRMARVFSRMKKSYLPKSVSQIKEFADFVNNLRNDTDGDSLIEVAALLDFLDDLPGFVRKVQQLDLVGVEKPIKGELKQILASATQCYLFGLNKPCIMLCRTAFEIALEKQLPQFVRSFGTLKKPDKKGKLEWYIDLGGQCGIFEDDGDDLTGAAHELRRFSNKIVHGTRIPSEDETREHLALLRKFMEIILRKPKS
jgi:hypothetical protein